MGIVIRSELLDLRYLLVGKVFSYIMISLDLNISLPSLHTHMPGSNR